jgi:hypothetical protein
MRAQPLPSHFHLDSQARPRPFQSGRPGPGRFRQPGKALAVSDGQALHGAVRLGAREGGGAPGFVLKFVCSWGVLSGPKGGQFRQLYGQV